MKYIMLAVVAVLFSGCFKDRIILVPSKIHLPVFKTTDFKEQKTPDLYIKETGFNVTITKEELLKYIELNKLNRAEYNVLLEKLIEFNLKLKLIQSEQNNKQPQEIK